MNQSSLSLPLRFLIGSACAAIGITFLHLSASYVNSFLLALLLSMAVSPLIQVLRRFRFPAALAYLVTLLIALLTLALAALMVPAMIVGLRRSTVTVTLDLAELWLHAANWLAPYGIDLAGLSLTDLADSEELATYAVEFIGRTLTSRALADMLDGVSMVLMTVLFTIFLLIEAVDFPEKVRWQLAQGNPEFDQLYGFASQIRIFVAITAICGLIGGILTIIVLWLLGIEFALLWGFAYFVLGFIPGVGLWLALIPPFLLALAEQGPLVALIVAAWYVLSSVFIGNVIKPAFMSGDLNLSPLWSIIAMVLWGAILGLPGLILGVPLTIAIRELLFERDEGSRWLAQMMGSGVPDSPSDVPDTEPAAGSLK